MIIRNILELHSLNSTIDCDPTFSIGNFYKSGIPLPKYIYDKVPQVEGVVEATSDNLPLEDESILTIMFDPPFVMGGKTVQMSKKGSGIISKRFSSFYSFDELKEMYSKSLKEFYRILKDKGIVIFKCQDVVWHHKNHFTHTWAVNEALLYNFIPVDLFVLLSKHRLTDKRKQVHARKFHSYFLVFKKSKLRVDYSSYKKIYGKTVKKLLNYGG